jgi:hypothetical protein
MVACRRTLPRVSHTDAHARLQAALIEAADALAQLPPREYAAMCREEIFEIVTTQQYFEMAGVPTSLPPALSLGNQIIRAMLERHRDQFPGPFEAA